MRRSRSSSPLGIYFIPPVHDAVDRRVDDLRTQIKYYFSPPDQAIFLPTQQAAIDTIVNATMQAHATQQAASTAPATSRASPGPTSAPTLTPTPLPPSVNLPGVVYVDQSGGWNLCAPANLTMALKFWGWKGTRDDVIRVVKPGENDPSKSTVDRGFTDKNVMPYELVDFVNEKTDYRALYRYGGDIQLIKTLLAAGFPLVVEKGYYEADYKGKVGWLGHYQFVTGYDDGANELIVQDTYHDGPNFHIPYDKFIEGWRSFDFVFYIVYPADREQRCMRLLGPYSDATSAAQKALDQANQDIKDLSGIDLFFAWFAKGTSHVALQQYVDAADGVRSGFLRLRIAGQQRQRASLSHDVVSDGTLLGVFLQQSLSGCHQPGQLPRFETIGAPTLEESLYWRGLAEYALGNASAGIGDVRRASTTT